MSSHAYSNDVGNNIYRDMHIIQKLVYKPKHHKTFLQRHHRLLVRILAPVVTFIAMLAVAKDIIENAFLVIKAYPELTTVVVLSTLFLSVAIGSNIGA